MPTPTKEFSVRGKSALITGAGSGINFCFAKLLLDNGCNVVMADLALRPEAQQLLDAFSASAKDRPRVIFVKTDVVNWKDLNHMFDVADQEFGGMDIVCPGAGVFEPPWSNFWHPPGDPSSKDDPHGTGDKHLGHYATLDINLTHPIRVTQLALSRWLNDSNLSHRVSTDNPKRIVHVASIAAQVPSFSTPMYIAAKHGLAGFIRSLALLEEEIGVRVNGVAPGIIKTPLWTEHPEKLRMLDETVDEWVMPEEVAEAMLSCVTDAEIGGGYVMEVLKGRRRQVLALNDPGPNRAAGGTVHNSRQTQQDALDLLRQPGWGKLIS